MWVKFCDVYEAAKQLNLPPQELWQANEHIVASEATNHNWDLAVPLEITKQLRFVFGAASRSPKFVLPDQLDQQTLRNVRKLTFESAALLDELLEDLKPTIYFPRHEVKQPSELLYWSDETTSGLDENSFESYLEGSKKQRFVTYYERIPENRRQAIRIHGYDCQVCGFNFEKTYGLHGKDFIHIHHLKPVSQLGEPQQINPATDLSVLCPNCHAMIHRRKDKTLSLEELKQFIAKNKF